MIFLAAWSEYTTIPHKVNGRLVEIIADAVGDCLGEAVLEGTASEQGGLAAVREVAHLDKDGRTAGSSQDVVTGCLNSKAVKTCAGHRTGYGTCRLP